MFDRYTRAVGQPGGGQEVVAAGAGYRVDITKTEKAFVIKAEIPEVKRRT